MDLSAFPFFFKWKSIGILDIPVRAGSGNGSQDGRSALWQLIWDVLGSLSAYRNLPENGLRCRDYRSFAFWTKPRLSFPSQSKSHNGSLHHNHKKEMMSRQTMRVYLTLDLAGSRSKWLLRLSLVVDATREDWAIRWSSSGYKASDGFFCCAIYCCITEWRKQNELQMFPLHHQAAKLMFKV